MAVYCKQGTSVKLPDESGNCPAGFTKYDTGSPGKDGGGSTTAPTSSVPQPYTKDAPVWNDRLPGMTPAYTPGSGLDYLHDWQAKGVAEGAKMDLSPGDQGLLLSIAKSQGGRSIGPVWQTFVDRSAMYAERGQRATPMELARQYAIENGIQPGGGPGSSGSGSSGPKPIDELGIRRAMDSVSTNLIGRTLSDAEFKKYYSSYTRDFSGDPGLDYQQHEVEAIKKEDDYQEMQVAQKFSKAFDAVLKGAM